MRQVHVFISGFVQGVGFRYFIKSNAKRLGLKGWVKNLSDGRVEAVLQPSAGSGQEGDEKIKQMIELCNKGPFLSEVKDLVVEQEEGKEVFEELLILK